MNTRMALACIVLLLMAACGQPPTPIPDFIADEEYAVYHDLLIVNKEMWSLPEGTETVVLFDHTFVRHDADDVRAILNGKAGVSEELVANYLEANSRSYPLEAEFGMGKPVLLVSQEAAKNLVRGLEYGEQCSAAVWAVYPRPEYGGWYYLSRVGFDARRQTALIYIEQSLCGGAGNFLVLENVSGVWQIKDWAIGLQSDPLRLDSPMEVSDEEYAVYNALLAASKEFSLGSGYRYITVYDQTGLSETLTGEGEGLYATIRQQIPAVTEELAANLIMANPEPYDMAPRFAFEVPVVLVSWREYEALSAELEEQECLAVARERFPYPAFQGWLRLSRVGFNQLMDQALVYVESHLCGDAGFVVLLEKQDDLWGMTAYAPFPAKVPATPPPSTLSESPSPAPTPETITPTATPRTPAPSATAPHAVTDLVPPLVVDSQAGRLYMTGRVDGIQQIVALAAADGSLVATYGLTGTIDVDPARGWLYVDQNSSGLLVLDAQTGEHKTLISLPGSRRQGVTFPAPQADPAAGQVLAFRDHLVYVIDPAQRTIVRIIPFDIPKGDDCRTLTDPLPIEWTVYDEARRLLYLDFVTYVCTPWIGESIVSFDMVANAQIAQQGVPSGPVSAFNGYLYGSGWYRMGMGYRWAWRDGKPWFVSEGWNNSARLFVDAPRGRLYESSSTYGFRAFDLETMSLLFILPNPVDGDLVGYDPGTDHLYYLREGQLATYPGVAILPPTPEPLQSADPPAKPMRQLLVSSAGPHAPSLFGLWDYGMTGDACYVFGAQGGLFYLSADAAKVWSQPQGGLGGGCDRISALAVSADYATDQMIFAALVGNGIFRSTDGGRLWRPASTGLHSMSIEQILLSPGFASDRMAFSRSRVLGQDNLYRSSDGGATWERLVVDLSLVAMSPEFDRDGVLMGVSADQVVVSRDRGETWETVGSVPEGDSITRLGLAPQFERWQVVFAFGSASQNLYRSADGGRSWDVVLSVGGHAFGPFPPQFVYGPEREGGRLLFLLATDSDPNADYFKDQGTLYRSEDGGLSWEALVLPADLAPTALAISPTYAQDGLIWLGTADGQVLSLEAASLPASP